MNRKYKLYKDSQLSEAQVESDIASYLGYITPFWARRFQLRAVDEQLTGSDKLFDRFVPIYLQFKVSEGLKPLAFGFNLSRPNLPLQRIRDFRRLTNISADPTLYFRLRDKAPTATDFQHNILKSFHRPPHQYAFYVAPLTLSIDEYNDSLKASLIDRFFTIDPFFYRDEQLITRTTKMSLGILPFLRGHISITPHEEVTTSEHYYSYSKSGGNIAWHSGEKIIGDFRLSNTIVQIFQQAYYSDIGITKETFVNSINNVSKLINYNNQNNQTSLDRTIIDFAFFLKKEYNIRLMILGNDNSK